MVRGRGSGGGVELDGVGVGIYRRIPGSPWTGSTGGLELVLARHWHSGAVQQRLDTALGFRRACRGKVLARTDGVHGGPVCVRQHGDVTVGQGA